jgi:DNA adenine methylase
MILARLGNKRAIAQKIINNFPKHRTFIELFFGAGGIFFYKQQSDYNFCNDLDDDVFNLYFTLKTQKENLIKELEIMPITETLLKHWQTNYEEDKILKSIRFLMLSNFGYLGNPDTLVYGQSVGNEKKIILTRIEKTFILLKDVKFMNCDFRKVLSKIQFRDDKKDAFIYSDPPYLNVVSNYQNKDWNEKDVIDCFDTTFNSGINGAMSEFDNPFVIAEAKKRNLNIIIIGERRNLKNKRTEILITNYENAPTLF